MGVVARHIYDHYIYPTSTGAFQISYYPTEGTAWRAHKRNGGGLSFGNRTRKNKIRLFVIGAGS